MRASNSTFGEDPAPRSSAGRFWERLADSDIQLLIAVVGVGALLRFWALGHQSFDYEEVVVARIIRGGLLQTVAGSLHERTPPIYYVLAWLWTQGFASDEGGLRALSAVLGTATIPAAYATGTVLATRRAGTISAVLVAVNPMLIWYSQYARAYVLLVLFTTIGLYFFVRGLQPGGDRHVLNWWAGISILALLTHYFAAFVVIPEAICLLYVSRLRLRVVLRVAAIGIVGIVTLPLIVFQAGSHALVEDYASRAISGRLGRTLGSFAAGPQVQVLGSDSVGRLGMVVTVVSGIALLCAFVLIAWRVDRAIRVRALIVGGVGLAALGLPVLLAVMGFDYVLARYNIADVVPLLLVTGVGLAATPSRVAGTGATTMLAGLGVAIVVMSRLSTSTQLPPSREIASAIGPPAGPRVLLVPKPVQKTLVYYLGDNRTRLIRRAAKGSAATGKSPGALRVKEVVVVGDTPGLPPPGRGFAVVTRRRVGQYWISGFRSGGVRSLTLHSLDAWRGGQAAVLSESP